MDNKEIYIEQQNIEDALFTRLQEHTINELQRLSAQVWTDFNVHDPGVTIADASNYLLTELDYKLNFELADYMTDSQGEIELEKYGLFSAKDVYTTTAVTANDYQKLLIEHLPNISSVQVEADVKTGDYHIYVVTSSFEDGDTNIEAQIRNIFHAHRNLCENIGSVTIIKPRQLTLYSELEVEIGCDVTTILAQIYWTIIQYLSGSVEIFLPEERLTKGVSLEKWMEGTSDGVRVSIPQQRNTEHELYLRLVKIKGINSFKSCYLKENGVIKTDFKQGYNLSIPRLSKDLHVCISVGCSQVKVDIERFVEELQAMYYTKGRYHKRQEDNQIVLKGTFRDIFSHYPIGMDLPDCYKTLFDGNTALEAYLKLYDLLAERGLKEIKQMQSLLSIESQTQVLSKMEILKPTTLHVDKKSDRYRDVFALKNKYFDFLDGLYGVDSNPSWLKEFDYYANTKDEQLLRRMNFLRHVALITRNRSKARDIKKWRSEDNIPTVKRHICYLLSMNVNEEVSVGNILPGHNLALMGDEPEGQQLRNKLNAMLVQESMLDKTNVFNIIMEDTTKEEYVVLRKELDIFNSNLISGGLFRAGVNLDNYKIVKANEKEYLLVFRNEEQNQWMNLKRSLDKERLNKLANILRCYLKELNCQCETVYVVEHNLFCSQVPFTLSFIFPNWTTRCHSLRFREICGELVRSLISPHLKVSLYWLDVLQMQFFEEGYRLWRKALADEMLPKDKHEIEQGIMTILSESIS